MDNGIHGHELIEGGVVEGRKEGNMKHPPRDVVMQAREKEEDSWSVVWLN